MDVMRLCILFICLFLTAISAVNQPPPNINNIANLKNANYGRCAPHHGLQLLFWFAQRVRRIQINQNNQNENVLTLDLNLNPSRGDFGFHYFGNGEGILPRGRRYYSVGNLNSPGANALPAYVREYSNRQIAESNMDRLMISVDQNVPNRVYNVYITAHNRGGHDFNSEATYEISFGLIEEIRGHLQCTVDQNNNYVSLTGEDDDNMRCREFLNKLGYNRRTKRSVDLSCDTLGKFKLEIKATNKGYSRVIWRNLPAEVMKYYVYIGICKNNHSAINSEDECQIQVDQKPSETQLSGTLDTSIPLNGNLQPRLLLYTRYFAAFGETLKCYGPELGDANGVIPTRIKGCDASLQLYTKDGWASARLYIKKTFNNWQDVFYYSWVGFYTGRQTANDKYSTYQYAVDFVKVEENNPEDYYIYKYESNLPIAPGVQIRFLLDKEYNKVLARTTPWEDAEKLIISPLDCDNPSKDSSYWLKPEFFYRKEFDDANRVIPTQISGFQASLQLITEDGKACALLYMKKTFITWQGDFYYSWVGFYTDEQKANNKYSTYQYAVKFTKVIGETADYVMYKYQSSLTIAPGVQLRFLHEKTYDSVLAQTTPWQGV